jgi:NTP pyrophosphatase (non-canonical NTP hydrolase)
MNLAFRIKHHFFNAFREVFVHHHGSLEFRAKIFALVIAANEKPSLDNFIKVKELALRIYENDEDRANLLLLTTKELVEKIKKNKSFNLDSLIESIQKELKLVPRYANKIDIDALESFLMFTKDEDTLAYQKNILEFLQNLKQETLQKN